MSELIPTPKSILKAAIGIILVFAIAEVAGFSSWLTNPVSMAKQKLGVG